MIDLSPRFKSILGFSDTVAIVINDKVNSQNEHNNALIKYESEGSIKYFFNQTEIVFLNDELELEENEILILFFKEGRTQRFFRPSSNSNTILLTEQCDQKCIMCSQPPKNRDYLHWGLYLDAIAITPPNSVIGISGGEPTLYLEELLNFIERAVEQNPSIQFHILTNAQHFKDIHIDRLRNLNEKILWGVPIYSASPDIHNQIVGKNYAFDKLLHGLNSLLNASARVELRTVILSTNYSKLLSLSQFVAKHLSWIEFWAIMQLEPIGFARIEWEQKFVDTSENIEILEEAVKIADVGGVDVSLYNFPKCTAGEFLASKCIKSISDWKRKYLPKCEPCILKESCTGFFEWYKEEDGFKIIKAETK